MIGYQRPLPVWQQRRREILDQMRYQAKAVNGTVIAEGNFVQVMDTLHAKGYNAAKPKTTETGLRVSHGKRDAHVYVRRIDG